MAFGVATFDELNKLVGTKRSMVFEQYFGEISGLTDEQKKERIRLAYLFEEQFLVILEDLYYDYPDIDPELIDRLRSSYIVALESAGLLSMTALEGTDAELYLVRRASNFAVDAVASTYKNLGDPYTFSEDRAAFMAETESQICYNASDFFGEYEVPDGATHKTWVTMADNKVRDSHAEIDGETIPIDEPFLVGGSEMMFPCDESMGAGAEEIVNCRCVLEFSKEETAE